MKQWLAEWEAELRDARVIVVEDGPEAGFDLGAGYRNLSHHGWDSDRPGPRGRRVDHPEAHLGGQVVRVPGWRIERARMPSGRWMTTAIPNPRGGGIT